MSWQRWKRPRYLRASDESRIRVFWRHPGRRGDCGALPEREVIFAIALIIGVPLGEAAIGSGVLLTIFGISMALTLGLKAPLGYSVFTAATAPFSLAVMAADHSRDIREGGNHESTVEV